MSIHIDPIELNKFAGLAARHAQDLLQLHIEVDLPGDSLGTFHEATDLVAAINSHTVEVNQRLQATAAALFGLSGAAEQVAALSGASDADIAKQMKTINNHVDAARRHLVAPRV